MKPRETRFLKVLVDNGLISFKEAGSLQETQEKLLSEAGEHKPVWDIAVDEGVVTSAQAERLLKKAGEDPAAETPDEAVQENTQALAPVKPAAGRSSRRKLGGYGLISKLGQGGMGAVYKAHQESMDRVVAIKVLPRDLAKNQDFIARFLREARAAGRLSHPNIVSGIDAGFADGYYYFAMEYVEGRSLGQRLGEEDALEEREVVGIGRQMADALEHAHAEGIVHRDVKPENILLTLGGEAKLCDLGLARSTGGEDLRVTQMGQAVGTPYYISPEQVRGEEPDSRADVYSLGCTLYHLAGGSPPFTGDNQMAVMQKHLTDTAAPLRQLKPGISPALERVVAKMMARDAEDRYQTAAEVAADLHKMAAGGVPSALTAAIAERRAAGRGRRRGARDTAAASTGVTRPISGAEAAALALGEDTADTRALSEAGGQRPPWKLIAIAGALLVLIAAVIGVVLLKGEDPPPPVVDPPIVEPAEDQALKKLAGEFAGLGAFAEENPKDYAELIKRYTEFLGRAAGTEYEEKAQEALAAVNDRQKADQSAERLKKLAAGLKAVQAYERKNPRKFAEIISKYTGFAAGAVGTEFEAKAKSAAAATRKRRGEQARKLLAETRRQVQAATKAGNFTAALAKIAAFPGLHFADVKAELGALEAEVRAAGKQRWGEILAEAQKLSKARKFDAAKKKATSARSLGLAALEVDISRALAQIEKDRQAYLDIVAAGYRKKYEEFAKALGKLVKDGKFDEAVKKGQALRGKLSPDLEARLKQDLALASGAAELIKKLRARLAAAKSGSFTARLPLTTGRRGRFQSYNPRTTGISFAFGPGSTTLRIRDFKGELLVALTRSAARGKQPAAELRWAACYLLVRGESAGVPKLLKAAKEDGVKVDDLEKHLEILGKGFEEVEAERLLARFDELFRRKSWAGAARVGERILKEHGESKAVKARKDLAKLIDQAKASGSPLAVYTLTFQEGQPVKAAGVAAYKGTGTGTVYDFAPHHDIHKKEGPGLLKAGQAGKWAGLIKFAVTRREGGPLPDDAEILSARLCITKVIGYVPYLELRRLTTPWSEKEVTYNSASRGRRWKTPGGDVEEKPCATLDLPAVYAKAGSTMSVAARKVWYGPYWCEFDVTESLRAALKEGKNYGWRMNGYRSKDRDVNINLYKFAGRLYEEDKNLAPKLILKVRCRRLPGG